MNRLKRNGAALDLQDNKNIVSWESITNDPTFRYVKKMGDFIFSSYLISCLKCLFIKFTHCMGFYDQGLIRYATNLEILRINSN